MKGVNFVVNGVKTSYKDFSLDNISFELKEGDILGLIGRSGSGKSTLIKTLMGLKKPDFGEISVKENERKKDLRNSIGYSPQDNSLFQLLTLEENFYTFGELLNVKSREIKKRMNFFLDRLNLKHAKNKKIVELSGGMRKRANIAISLLHNPKIIILDEPFNGLDIAMQMFIWEFLKELAKRGRIIVVSSHNIKDIEKNCSKFALVEGGKVFNNQKLVKIMNTSKYKSIEKFIAHLFIKQMKEEQLK